MGIISWFNAGKYVSRLSASINSFPEEKHIDYLVQKMESGAEEIVLGELVKGFDKKINPDNVSDLGEKYINFCRKLLPNTDLAPIKERLSGVFTKADINKVKVFANIQIDENSRLSPEGVQRIIEYSNNLKCDVFNTAEKVKKAYSMYIDFWNIDNGIFSSVPSDFILKPKEECYWRSMGNVFERKEVTKRINYAGPRARIKIAKGVHYNLGSISPTVRKELQDIDLGYGTVNITNKNILYKGRVKQLSIPISSIMDVELYSDACIIYRNRGNPLIYKLPNQVSFNKYITALLG